MNAMMMMMMMMLTAPLLLFSLSDLIIMIHEPASTILTLHQSVALVSAAISSIHSSSETLKIQTTTSSNK